MVPQEKVDAHVNQILELAVGFESQVVQEVDSVVGDVLAHLAKVRLTQDGLVAQSPKNASSILAIEGIFQKSLNSSNYYPTLLAFVENFVDQVDNFDTLHSAGLLSSDILADGDRDVLAQQASVAVAVLEGHSAQVAQELCKYLSVSLGEIKSSTLSSEVNAIVRKMSHVGPIGKDQCNTWYRLLSSLIFRRAEERGTKLSYTYVGQKTKSTRGFCSKLLAGGPLSLEKISALDNGQTSDALLNGGGYGCNHFWFGEVVG